MFHRFFIISFSSLLQFEMFNVLIKNPTIRLEDGLIASDDREGGASVESFVGQRV